MSSTGHNIVQEPTPAERIATISLSLPIRENPMIIPARVASGIEKVRTPGKSVAPIRPSTRERQVCVKEKFRKSGCLLRKQNCSEQ